MSEAEYLAKQAQDARDAMNAVVTKFKASLGASADPKLLLKDHPWLTIGAGIVGGFAAASMLVPSKEEQALKKLERLEDALLPERRQMRDRLKAEADAKVQVHDKPAKPGIGATIVKELLGVIKPAIMSAVAAGVSSKVAQPDDGQGGNGAHAQGMAAGAAVGTAASPPGEDTNV